MTFEKLTFAIVGCGRIGNRHAGHIKKIGHLLSVCDPIIGRCQEIITDSLRCFTSLDELFESGSKPDVVSVCSPNGLHAEHSIKALRSGCHVLCEKPMALSSKDCLEMIREANLAKKRLFIVKQNRFNPPIAAVKMAIDNDRLGKIFSVQLNCFWNRNEKYYKDDFWRGTKLLDGGTLFTQYSHFIDLVCWLFGDVEQVRGFSDNYDKRRIIEFEDTGVAVLRFKSGTIGTIHHTINAFQTNMEGSITIFSENATIKIGGQYLNIIEYQKIRGPEITHEIGNNANQYGHYQGSMSNHGDVYKNVVECLTNKGEIAVSAQEGLTTVETIEKIYDAYK
tara:strand:- start:455 stop:1462 length:1008 start_codon:yes stop_codon:yes gene_type:complete